MEKLYYFYYLFYKKVLNDDEPHLLTILVLSASCSFPIVVFLQLLFAELFCETIDTWKAFSVIPIMVYINYLCFFKSGRYVKILNEKPLFFKFFFISCLLVIYFFILTALPMFFSPFYLKDILINCGR